MINGTEARATPKPASAAAREACPTCGRHGRKVKRVTLESLLGEDRRADIADGQYYVCETRDCPTVYFGAPESAVFEERDLTVRFGLKETDSPRPVCYCFDHTVEDIEDEIRRTGDSTVIDRIKADMQGPGCRCEYTNPLGRCCLDTVQAAVDDVFRSVGRQKGATVTAFGDHRDCCADNEHGASRDAVADCCGVQGDLSTEPRGRDRTGALAAGGSVLAAVFSSACCWLPLLLIAFGASAAGVAGFFETNRPYFIVGAVGLLAVGFYMAYFRKERCEPGAACATPNRKLRAFNWATLWVAMVLVAAFVFFPNYVGVVFGAPSTTATDASGGSPDASTRLAAAEFNIEGMTCEGCANILRGALLKLPDVVAVDVDYPKKTAVVRYAADRPVSAEQVVEAVKAAGYSASPAAKTP